MELLEMAFTAVFIHNADGYTGFIEELPRVNSHGRTLDEAREMLRTLASQVFEEEREEIEELLSGRDEVIREAVTIRFL